MAISPLSAAITAPRLSSSPPVSSPVQSAHLEVGIDSGYCASIFFLLFRHDCLTDGDGGGRPTAAIKVKALSIKCICNDKADMNRVSQLL